MTVEFQTRPAWNGMGDIIHDGIDLGWSSKADAEALAEREGVTLIVTTDADYIVKNPRREA
jgi:hypothetical protein